MSAPENSKPSLRIPPWLRVKLPCNHTFSDTRALVEGLDLHTVCHSAKCPNMFECFSRKTATFLILGNTCTATVPSATSAAASSTRPTPKSPPAVGKALAEFVKHVDEPFSLGYMPSNGFGWAREKLAAHLSKEQGAELTANDVILTCGAAGALNVIFRTVLEPGDEVLTVTPISWNTAPMWATTAVRSRRSRPCRVPSGLICPPLRRPSRPRPAP